MNNGNRNVDSFGGEEKLICDIRSLMKYLI
jgi:hypothetical protein